jgi:hypothetical protein
LQDDSIGGDTNGDGVATTPTNFDWSLTFAGENNDSSQITLEYLNINYANQIMVRNP